MAPSRCAVPMLYGSDKGWCMVAGHQAAECPDNPTYDGWWWPKESVHLDETRWCSKENVVEWDRSGERYGDPPKAKWGTKMFQGTCCYYPPIEEVYDARYVKIQIWDEDTFTNNDMLGEFNVDLKEAAESGKGFGVWNYDFDVQELKKNGQAENNVFKAKVRVQWERPHDNAIATTYDLSPGLLSRYQRHSITHHITTSLLAPPPQLLRRGAARARAPHR